LAKHSFGCAPASLNPGPLDGNFCLGWDLFKEEPAVHGGQGERLNNIQGKITDYYMLNKKRFGL